MAESYFKNRYDLNEWAKLAFKAHYRGLAELDELWNELPAFEKRRWEASASVVLQAAANELSNLKLPLCLANFPQQERDIQWYNNGIERAVLLCSLKKTEAELAGEACSRQKDAEQPQKAKDYAKLAAAGMSEVSPLAHYPA